MNSHRAFLLRRLHSLSGIIPVGVFLSEHLFLNAFALKGPAVYDRVIAFMHSLPFLLPIELGVILIPLAFHGTYGLWISWTAKNNLRQYTHYRNWMFYLQRVAGVIAFIFVCYHVYSLRLRSLFFGQVVSFSQMAGLMEDPSVFWFYAAGLVASLFHFANGICTFAITWGLAVGPNSQRVANIAGWIIFVTLTVVGINVLVVFR